MFVCLCVCSLSPLRSFDGSSPNLVDVCRWTSHLPLRGSFSKRSTGQRVDGSTGHFHFPLYYICASLTPHSCNSAFCFAASAAESNSAPFAALHLNGVCRWTSQLPLRGSFSKRSTGRRVNGSTGQRVKQVHGSHLDGVCRWTSQLPLRGSFSKRSTGRQLKESNGSTGQQVTFTLTILYMIADDARIMPPRCKKHTVYDDTRLTPHHCKKHTASFARSTGKFPSEHQHCEISKTRRNTTKLN